MGRNNRKRPERWFMHPKVTGCKAFSSLSGQGYDQVWTKIEQAVSVQSDGTK